MLEFDQLVTLIKTFEETTIDEMNLEHGTMKLSLKKASTKLDNSYKKEITSTNEKLVEEKVKTEEKPIKKDNDEEYHKITAPMVGTFYMAPNPESEPFVKKGENVTKDQPVCILEAMKLFNEIQSDVKGQIVEILVENGQLVEYGQPLFLIKVEN